MKPPCRNCHLSDPSGSKVYRWGGFFRHSTQTFVRKFRCSLCKTYYSEAIFDPAYRQKKRQYNGMVVSLLSHEMSQRETARVLKLNYKTVVKKFRSEGFDAEAKLYARNLELPKAQVVEFDDLETFEHTKHKPLSVTIAVEGKTRRILSVDVAVMPARGRLAKKAREKYGKRADFRQKTRKKVFARLQDFVHPLAEMRSDANPSYPSLVKKFFPQARHKRFLGRRGCVTGQGEIKEGKFDPLFSINHTCAMFRANVNRLIRKTWCTTKAAEQLRCHLMLYAHQHNMRLEETARRKAEREALKTG